MEKFIIGLVVAAAILLLIALFYGIAGACFAFMWNWLMPSLWAAAPHFTWKMGVAAAWLIAIVQSIFGGGFQYKKEK